MSWWLIYSLLEWVIRLVMVPVILRKQWRPTTALAWLSVVFFLPELGLSLYLLLGGHRLGRRRIRLHRQIIAAMRSAERLADQAEHIIRPDVEPALESLIVQAESIGGFDILGGNDVELLDDVDITITRLIQDSDAAQHHIHLSFYIFANDVTGKRVADALVRAQRRGVACRVLADAAASWKFFSRAGLARYLNENGVRTLPLLPAAPLRRKFARLDLRNHRKLAVIDGAIAYAGSQNIVNADYGHRGMRWLDLMGRFTGPIVAQLQTIFLEDWTFETAEPLDSSDIFPPIRVTGTMAAQAVPTGPSHESATLPRVLLAAIHSARRKIIITSPYLVPDEPMMLALEMAAERNVEVDIVLPHKSDHPLVAAAGRAYYDPLIDAGVDIFLHERGMLHAKTITVDDSFALLGSSNLDIRSFYLNFELNVLLYGPQITHELRFAQMRYLAESVRVDRAAWRRRSVVPRYFENAAALFSPLL